MSEKCRQKTIPKLNHGALQLKLSLKRRLGLLQFLLTNRKTPNMTYFTLVWWNVEGFDNYECVKSQMWKGPAISTTSHFLLCFYPFSLVYSSCPRCFWEGGWQWQQERWRTLLGTRAEEVWTWRHTGHLSLLLLAWPPPSLQKEKTERRFL